LLDEPAAGVDVTGQEQFYDLLGRLNRERGTTIVLVSHDVSMVSKHAHHILCLKDGHIHCQGSPQEINRPETLQEVFGKDRNLFVHEHE
jgi:ABC-type Mn2+/Zn2+ transport system ATPase subunit